MLRPRGQPAISLARPHAIAYIEYSSDTGCSQLKPRPLPRRRRPPARDILPPDVPEAANPAPAPAVDAEKDLPDHIRQMLEAAYT